MRYKVGGKVYSLDALERVTLKDVLVFDGQAADVGLSCTWDDVMRLAELDEDAMTGHQQMLMFGVAVWAAQRVAGEPVTLDEALSHPVQDYEVLPDPQDRKVGSRPPTKGQGPRKKKTSSKAGARKGSAAAAADAPSTTAPETAPQD